MTPKAATARLTLLPGAASGPAERLLFAARSLMACRVDADGRIVAASEAFESRFGAAPAGLPLVAVLGLETDASLAGALADPPGADRPLTASLVGASGERLDVVARVVRDGTGALVALEPGGDRPAGSSGRRPGAVIVVDVDRLQWVNDRYGRDVGDGIVRAVASTLEAGARRTDVIEPLADGAAFAVTLDACSAEDAVVWAERVRARLREIRTLGSGEALTASFGVAELRFGETAGGTRSRAEAALRLAKAEGRDRVRLAR